jgi:hypothetical protein
MRSYREVFADKLVSIVAGVVRSFQKEGVRDVADNVVKSISEGYMLLLQMVWYRIPNDSKVDNFIKTYETLVENALTLLSKYQFNDIVTSYRAKHTNLYTAKGGKRTYDLNFTTCEAFIKDAIAGKVAITKHVVTRIKQVAVSKPNSLLLKIANKLAVSNTQPQVAVSKPQPTQVAVSKPKVVTPGFFTEVKDKSLIQSETFVRVVLINGWQIFGRWEVIVSPTFKFAVKNKLGQVMAMKEKDVVSVSTYTKAVRS